MVLVFEEKEEEIRKKNWMYNRFLLLDYVMYKIYGGGYVGIFN